MEKTYGIVYAQVCLPRDHGLEWLRWCNSPMMLTEWVREKIKDIVDGLNNKWKDELIVKFNASPMPTCLCKPGRTSEIAQDLCDRFNEFMTPYTEIEQNMRVVWTEGEMPEVVEQAPTAHQLGNYPPSIKMGKSLEAGNECGVFKV